MPPIRPGTSITVKETAPPRSSPTDTGVWFVTGIAEKGPAYPQLVQSMTDYQTYFGARITTGILYDVLDTYFREGGSKAYVQRIVGPAAVIAFKNLNDAGAAISLVVKAENAGAWGNSLRVAVLAPDVAGYKIQISHVTDGILETTGDLATQADAVAWSQYSSYVNITLGASSNIPVVAAAAPLATGNDDSGAITETQWKAALDKFSVDLGPGQVSHPGRTTTQAYIDVLAHAHATNRAALLDAVDTSTKSTLLAAAAGARLNGRKGGFFAPWCVVPGIVAGTTRTVPPSALIAGLIARNDLVNGAGTPAAGERGQSQFVSALSQAGWTDTDRTDLNAAGVSVIISKYGGIRNYGWRSLADPVSDLAWVQFSNWRLAMQIIAELNPILEEFLFDVIDGQKTALSQFGGAISAELLPFWTSGQLYGESPTDAFNVDVGPQVNTPTTIMNGEIHAVVSVRMSPFAELVQLDLVKRSITQAVA
jgi:phage tail sheath protein FI